MSFSLGQVKSSEDHESLLAGQRSKLQRIREQGAPDSAPRTGGQKISASAGNGAVHVVMRDRRLVAVEITAGLTRQRGEVSGVLREAINQALARALAESPRAGDPTPDLGSIGDQLADFARQGADELRRIQGAVEQNMAKLAGKVQISGDASPQYVDFLFEDALDLVRSMQSTLAGSASEPVIGAGCDDSEGVEAVVSQGELTELTLTEFALEMEPGELGVAVSEAVNDALIEWEEHSAEAAHQDVDVEALQKLGERADAVRAQSMQHLRNYTDSMTSIMRKAE